MKNGKIVTAASLEAPKDLSMFAPKKGLVSMN